MIRFVIFIASVCLFLQVDTILAQSTDPPPPTTDLFETDLIDRLGAIELPKEASPPSSRPPDETLDGLAGLPITQITAVNLPAGFDPVTDSDVPLGLPINANLVRNATRALWQTGRYRDIQIYGRPGPNNGVELLIEVKPMLRIRKLDIKGNNALGDDDIVRAIDFTPDQTVQPDPEALRIIKQKLLRSYGRRGYREVRAALKLETTDTPGEVALVFEISEGKPERYTKISIPNLPGSIPASRLIRSVGLKSRMLRDKTLVEKALDELIIQLAKEGYQDAYVEKFRETRRGPYNFDLEIDLRAGLMTTFFFYGNRSIPSENLKKELFKNRLRTKPDQLEYARKKVLRHYRHNGFFHAAVTVRRGCIDAKSNVKVMPSANECAANTVAQMIRIDIHEGPTVEVADVLFDGNTFFKKDDLKQEVFAYMHEQFAYDGLFQLLNTETADSIGMSDRPPARMPRSKGMKAPRYNEAATYVPETYAEAMGHLAEMYHEQGFLEATVTDTCNIDELTSRTHKRMRFVPFKIRREEDVENTWPCTMINPRRDQLLVLIKVNEGPRTLLHKIDFEGNERFDEDTLKEAAGISMTDPYNEYRLREASEEMLSLYQSNGHMFAKVHWNRLPTKHGQDEHEAHVVFFVDEGPQVRVGTIRIEGAASTSKRILKEQLTLESGDIITPEQLSESQARLLELGVLDSAVVQMVAPETETSVKNLRIQVTEGKPQAMEWRVGIATVEGVRGSFEYVYRNVGGWAMNARLRARANYRLVFIGEGIDDFEQRYRKMELADQLEHHLLVGAGQPFLPGTKGRMGWGIDAIKEQINSPAFSADRRTAFLNLNSAIGIGKFRRSLTIWLRTGIESNIITPYEDVTTLNPTFNQYSRLPEGESVFWVTGLELSLDRRNHPFNPSKGFLLSAQADWIRSVADNPHYSNLIRTNATASGYIPLFKTEMVLAMSISVGYIFHLQTNSTTWSDRYFYIGGVDTLRGFPEESLVPEDIYQQWREDLPYSTSVDDLQKLRGGQASLITRFELRYPLAAGFYGAGFFEAGNLWRDLDAFQPIGMDPFSVNLRPVAGGGVRYLTPLGPFSLDMGVNLNKRPQEGRIYWYLSIGTTF